MIKPDPSVAGGVWFYIYLGAAE